jgi:AcrR family transcriptional regulator
MEGGKRREQIVWAALRLAADGLGNVTLKGVAEAIGVVPSALYRHFRNKESMMDAVIDLVGEKLMEKAREVGASEPDALRALKGLAAFHARMFAMEPGLIRLVFSEESSVRYAERNQRVLLTMAMYRGLVESILRRGQAAGQVRGDVPAEDLVYMYIGALVPPAFLYMLSGGEFDMMERFERSWSLFEEMARPREGGGDA